MTGLLLAVLLAQSPVTPVGKARTAKVAGKSGFAIGDEELSFTVKGPRSLVFKLYGDADLHGRSVWLDIERDNASISENTLTLVDQRRGSKKLRAQAELELEVPAGEHTYRVRASDPMVVLFGKPSAGGGRIMATPETALSGSSNDTARGAGSGESDSSGEGDDHGGGAVTTSGGGTGDRGSSDSGSTAAATKPPRASRRAAPSTGAALVGYDEGFYVETADRRFRLVQNGRLQTRYALTTAPGLSGDAQQATFSIPRAHFEVGGHAFGEDFGYRLELNFGEGWARVKDCYVDTTLIDDTLLLRVGQWKRPFSRQQMTSGGRLQFVDRALTNDSFDTGRDIGIGLHNGYERSPGIEWVVALLNGESVEPRLVQEGVADLTSGELRLTDGSQTNVPALAAHALAARVGYNSEEVDGYVETDFDGGPFRFGVASSVFVRFDSDGGDDATFATDLDLIAKVAGFSASGAFYAGWTQSGEGMFAQDLAAMGFHLQLGYLLGEWAEPAVRYAMLLPAGDGNNLQEIDLGFSAYLVEHFVKVQTDLGMLLFEGAGFGDGVLRWRTQMQLAF